MQVYVFSVIGNNLKKKVMRGPNLMRALIQSREDKHSGLNAALTHRQICLRMCLRMKIFDIFSKFATLAEYL